MSTIVYTLIGMIGCFSVLKMLVGREKMYATLFLNVIFGGAFYLMLNILEFVIPFNTLSASCIMGLGLPGVIMLMVLKVMFGTI